MNRLIVIAFAAALLCTGCSSLIVARQFNEEQLHPGHEPIAHVSGQIWGVYLFNWIPLGGGDPDKIGDWRLFKDTVEVENAVDMLTRETRAMGAEVVTDLYTAYDSQWLAYTLIMWRRDIDFSANASK